MTHTTSHRRPALRRIAATFALLACMSVPATAQDLGVKAPPQRHPVLIRDVTVHPVSADVIASGWILFEGGVITGVGSGQPPRVPGDTEVIDGAGRHVYPGLIGANTVMGLMEIGSVRATIDYAETGSVTPEVRAAVSVNPDSTIIPVTRSNGILTVAVLPVGGVIPGRPSVIRMDGWTWEDLAIDPEAGLLINWPNVRPARFPGMRRSEAEQMERVRQSIQAIDDAFDEAAAYFAARTADSGTPVDIRLEAMRAVMEGGDPVFIRANAAEQIQSAVAWAARRGFPVVIVGGSDAAECTDLLLRHDVGVIVTGTHVLPSRRDNDYDECFTLPAKLEAAGVRWCLGTPGGSFLTPHERNLPYHAATAVAYGLDHDAALRSITLSAAELLGVGDRLGSLEADKAATLILTDGDPLEITTHVQRAFIDGREIDLANKQTALYEKYREKYRQLGLIP
ncbi:MAG: amidohydrolase family protein [Phycisphaerales bacterium]|nr:amidohydrolase family protein [Phycisphaerales bacterium]